MTQEGQAIDAALCITMELRASLHAVTAERDTLAVWGNALLDGLKLAIDAEYVCEDHEGGMHTYVDENKIERAQAAASLPLPRAAEIARAMKNCADLLPIILDDINPYNGDTVDLPRMASVVRWRNVLAEWRKAKGGS